MAEAVFSRPWRILEPDGCTDLVPSSRNGCRDSHCCPSYGNHRSCATYALRVDSSFTGTRPRSGKLVLHGTTSASSEIVIARHSQWSMPSQRATMPARLCFEMSVIRKVTASTTRDAIATRKAVLPAEWNAMVPSMTLPPLRCRGSHCPRHAVFAAFESVQPTGFRSG